jgi:predicted exporter
MTGPGVFAAEARNTIEHEALRLSLISTALIVVLLWSVYRSVPLLLLGLMPVLSGALAGVAAVALGYGVVHGVTLGFGVTLIGEAVDYSIYLFMQAREKDWVRSLWPTIRLGMLTSICGFASLLPSQFPGLAQLGLYSITGLLAAGLATRYVLPHTVRKPLQDSRVLIPGRLFQRALGFTRPLRHALWLLPPLAAVALWMRGDHLWERNLAALSPVRPEALQLDASLRADLGAPDVTTLVVLAGDATEPVLQAAERLEGPLATLVERGVIAGFQSPARYLPSLATQRVRQASLPPGSELQPRLQRAVADLPVRAERLQPFLDDIERARTATLVGAEQLAGTSLGTALDSLLLPQAGRSVALLPLQPPVTAQGAGTIDADAVRDALRNASAPGVELMVLDIGRETAALYAGYMRETVRQSLLGALAIVVLLAIALRSPLRVARVVLPLVLAVLAVLLLYAATGRPLTLLHLVGLLLVIAVGSNYALFFDGERNERTLASLLVANACTVLAFGALAFSSMPVLSALGGTVAPGALLALLFSAWLARDDGWAGEDAR